MKRGAKSAAALCIFCLCFFAFPRIAGSYCYVSLIYKINEDKLERAVSSLRAGCAATLPELRGVRGVSFESADGTVGFACFSFGIAPAGFYTGFYHSPDGAPKAFQNAKIELRPDGESWRYDEPVDSLFRLSFAHNMKPSLYYFMRYCTGGLLYLSKCRGSDHVRRALRLCGVIFRAFC